ncbi:MAG: hypothetical protein ACI8R4_000602 [Paracoccaceae bacterium]|jgi:hypothetical protein
MLILVLTYVILSLGTLITLSGMILKIGTLLADCPQTTPATKAVAVTIATGFAAIGAGGVILIGAALPVLSGSPVLALMLALGLAALCLGLGFSHALATLRAVLHQATADVAPQSVKA